MLFWHFSHFHDLHFFFLLDNARSTFSYGNLGTQYYYYFGESWEQIIKKVKPYVKNSKLYIVGIEVWTSINYKPVTVQDVYIVWDKFYEYGLTRIRIISMMELLLRTSDSHLNHPPIWSCKTRLNPFCPSFLKTPSNYCFLFFVIVSTLAESMSSPSIITKNGSSWLWDFWEIMSAIWNDAIAIS